ncbi:MAG: pilus assembly protein TadG-related protein, partial [Methyloligellaceae bacterium]
MTSRDKALTHRTTNQRPFYRRFIGDRRGVTAIIFAIMLIPLLAMIGGAIDFSRAFIVKTRLQSALDAAVLATAAAASLGDAERIAYGKTVFKANYPSSELGTPADAVITITADGRVTGSVSADLSSTILGVIGFDNLTLNSTNEAQAASLAEAEIVLVLDYSGSMNSRGKYQAMRKASINLIKTLSKNGSNDKVKFGLVPFSKHVYGTIKSDYIVNEAPGGQWTNCTMDRKWPYNIQDSTPLLANDDTKWGMTCSGDDKGKKKKDDDDDDDKGGSCNPYAVCFNYKRRNLIVRPLTSDHAAVINQLQV